jgi:hypothetical protein
MKLKNTTLIITFILLLLISVGTALAVNVTVGVSKGDIFTFNYKCYFSSDNPQAEIPADFLEINQTDWFRLRITDVSGNYVKYETSLHYINETENNGNATMNIGSGDIDWDHDFGLQPVVFYMIAADLSTSNNIFPLDTYSQTIAETSMHTYESGQRETNSFTNFYGDEITSSEYIQYFDKTTGILVDLTRNIHQTIGDYSRTLTEKVTLRESSSWVVPEFPPIILLPVMIIALLTMFIAIKKK